MVAYRFSPYLSDVVPLVIATCNAASESDDETREHCLQVRCAGLDWAGDVSVVGGLAVFGCQVFCGCELSTIWRGGLWCECQSCACMCVMVHSTIVVASLCCALYGA
jgi:hypothetical protein